MKKLALLFVIISVHPIIAQLKTAAPEINYNEYVPHKSIHQEQSEKYASYGFSSEEQWDSLRLLETGAQKKAIVRSPNACNLTKRVYGWQPYWNNTSATYNNYDWNGLTDLCYFSYDVNSADGNATSTHGWSTATVVTAAQSNGVNVTLCATLFSGHTAFFGSSAAQQTLITNLINLVQARNAHGVNIDFEGMGASHKTAFTAFMINLCNQMHAAIPGSEVSIALYAVDWSGVFDMTALNPYVDLFIIMGYDYYYSGSTTAGPEDPLYNFQTSYNYTLTKSISYYLNKGASKSKLLLGLPWYGREWATSASTIPSATTSGGTNSVLYSTMRNNTSGNYSNRLWDANSFSSYFTSVRSGVNWQTFIDDAPAMSERFDMVNRFGIGGIGIWALGYDDGYNDFWDLIQAKFTDCATVPCSDTIYDMGGPNRNYYDNENYTFTIAPTGASGLTLNFTSFATELNYDTLWIYNGASTASPLIGAYHGSASPGLITASGNALTLKYKSDVSTQAAGWTAIWNCTIDNIDPSTSVTAPNNWVTGNFSASFTDTDNSGGTGILKSYYQVLEYNGTEWRANNANGFFSDNFDAAIHPDWTSMAGTWSIAGGYLNQSDQTNTNTNIYAPLSQNLSNQYLYNWQGKISGMDATRRAGFHFFCGDATQTNRGNSYFVWFRISTNMCEFYKVVNNTFSLQASVPMTINTGQWYDYKVIYDRISGKMEVYQNDNFIGSWTDPSPYANGNAISFRSANCDYTVNDLKVYRSRLPSVTVSVGPGSTNDVRYQNPDPSTPSCRIKSITKDGAANLSAIASQDVDVDWSLPSSPAVSDGVTMDIDTTYSLTQLSANWSTAVDVNSGVSKYWYAIGTSAGASDVVNWTDNGMLSSVTKTGLSLTPNQMYYFSIQSEDGAGLLSNVSNSDGQMVVLATGLTEQENNFQLNVYPNPFNDEATVVYYLAKPSSVEICLVDILGKQVRLTNSEQQSAGKHSMTINKAEHAIAKGMYTLILRANGTEKKYKLISN
ncbi:MAG: N-acetylmuramyl-L-alanine amidase, negative regulator of AmpC, AmpD [Bacteroidota bacterium]|jgi:spore germination protein YaaH|nr:N-acetylmuramyl-L-alanine amidase, negative regulator of AmpC, AmpD [Bacteroidota bacterium]